MAIAFSENDKSKVKFEAIKQIIKINESDTASAGTTAGNATATVDLSSSYGDISSSDIVAIIYASNRDGKNVVVRDYDINYNAQHHNSYINIDVYIGVGGNVSIDFDITLLEFY